MLTSLGISAHVSAIEGPVDGGGSKATVKPGPGALPLILVELDEYDGYYGGAGR